MNPRTARKLKRLALQLVEEDAPVVKQYKSPRALYRAMKRDWSKVPDGIQRKILKGLGK